jgi:hypothetical protein
VIRSNCLGKRPTLGGKWHYLRKTLRALQDGGFDDALNIDMKAPKAAKCCAILGSIEDFPFF